MAPVSFETPPFTIFMFLGTTLLCDMYEEPLCYVDEREREIWATEALLGFHRNDELDALSSLLVAFWVYHACTSNESPASGSSHLPVGTLRT